MSNELTPYQIVQITIAICKKEVEDVIGADVLEQLDSGSPWGRAFMKAVSSIRELEVEGVDNGTK